MNSRLIANELVEQSLVNLHQLFYYNFNTNTISNTTVDQRARLVSFIYSLLYTTTINIRATRENRNIYHQQQLQQDSTTMRLQLFTFLLVQAMNNISNVSSGTNKALILLEVVSEAIMTLLVDMMNSRSTEVRNNSGINNTGNAFCSKGFLQVLQVLIKYTTKQKQQREYQSQQAMITSTVNSCLSKVLVTYITMGMDQLVVQSNLSSNSILLPPQQLHEQQTQNERLFLYSINKMCSIIKAASERNQKTKDQHNSEEQKDIGEVEEVHKTEEPQHDDIITSVRQYLIDTVLKHPNSNTMVACGTSSTNLTTQQKFKHRKLAFKVIVQELQKHCNSNVNAKKSVFALSTSALESLF